MIMSPYPNILLDFLGQSDPLPKGDFKTARVDQIHSATCVYRGHNDIGQISADAMITDQPGVALVIMTADCVPILLYGTTADDRPMIGAAHAGWRGALAGVVENTVAMMVAHGAVLSTIISHIGPCIRQKSYEVSPGFEGPFLADDPGSARFFKQDGKLWFDLPGYVTARLTRLGIGTVVDQGVDTYTEVHTYHSYRRATHQAVPSQGRNLSIIRIKD